MSEFNTENCIRLLTDRMKALETQGESRYPKRSDFTDEEVCAIKAFLGPWPRALEKAGIKPVTGNTAAEKSREKRIRAKRRRTEAMKAAKKTAKITGILMLLCGMFMLAFARTAAAEEETKVFVSISEGKIVFAHSITIRDTDGDGILSINDALYVAHEKYFDGGAKAGYLAEQTAYGLSMMKLWGIENGGSYGYNLNNQPAMSLADPVKDGDFVYAYVYTDSVGFSDTYAFFTELEVEGTIGSAITLQLNRIAYDENWNTVELPVPQAQIIVDGVATQMMTDDSGKVMYVPDSEGVHQITAKSSEMVLVPPICIATIEPATSPALQADDISWDILNAEIDDPNWMVYSSLYPIQSVIDKKLAPSAGSNSDWMFMGLSREYSTIGTEVYEKALRSYIDSQNKEQKKVSAVTKLRYALSFVACHKSDDSYVSALAEENIGKQGIMSYAYGLMLISNGVRTPLFGPADIIAELLNRQLPDGGWALSGTVSDVDVTAIVLQALAPYQKANSDIERAITNGVSCLLEKQSENGEFQSYGVYNSESVSQVIIALCALSIDPIKDERFMKNGRTLIDVLAGYHVGPGQFAHTEGGEPNEMATMQAFLASVAVSLYERSDGNLFLWNKNRVPLDEVTELPNLETDTKEEETPEEKTKETGKTPAEQKSLLWKIHISKLQGILLILIAVITIIGILICLIKKKSFRYYLFCILFALVAGTIVILVDLKTPDEYYGDTEKGEQTGKVTMGIRCDTIAVKSDSDLIPKDGTILANTEFPIEEGDTVYDVLCDAAKKYHIQNDHSGEVAGSTKFVYVSSIQNLYEGDFGELSGWVYHVNGESPAKSCGDYVVRDGDRIMWLYSLELGNDVLEFTEEPLEQKAAR